MNFRLELLFLVSLTGICLADYIRTVSYQGDVLVKCSGLQRAAVQHLMETVDVWRVGEEGRVDFRVSSEQFQSMKGDLPECREEGSVEDLIRSTEQAMYKRNLNRTKSCGGQYRAEWFEEYHDYEEIVEWYEDLSKDYPDLVEYVYSIGQSLEGRDLPAVHITASTSPSRKKYYFQCQIHAREWISGATCMYIANYLVENYNSDEQVTRLLDETEFVIVPIVNPDGYAYTWTGDRLWRKNRRPGSCYGVDLNRNYPDHWAEGGSSNNPCSEVYHGSSAASEPETRNTITYFISQATSSSPVIGAIDWHSYSQLVLRPYGWTDEDAPDEDRLRELGDEMAEAIYAVHGKYYSNQKSIGLYPTTGSADDWFYSDDANQENGEIRSASYTIELRDTGNQGFLLDPSQIIPTGQEIVAAVMVFAKSLNETPLYKQ